MSQDITLKRGDIVLTHEAVVGAPAERYESLTHLISELGVRPEHREDVEAIFVGQTFPMEFQPAHRLIVQQNQALFNEYLEDVPAMIRKRSQ